MYIYIYNSMIYLETPDSELTFRSAESKDGVWVEGFGLSEVGETGIFCHLDITGIESE